MRLLDRYLLRELMIPLPYCLAGFLIFWVSSDLISEVDEFKSEKLTALDVGEYYLARLPEYLVLLLPVVLLLALLYALATHARHQEFTAMRAAGRGIWRIALPYLAVGLFFTVMVFCLNEFVVPEGKEHADRVRNRHRVAGAEDRRMVLDLKFRNEAADRFWRIRVFNLGTGEMTDPYVEWRTPEGQSRRLLAASGVHTNGMWVFRDGQVIDPDPESKVPVQPFAELAVPELEETPGLIRGEYKVAQLDSVRGARKVQLTVSEILAYLELHPNLPRRLDAVLRTQLHARLATPWTSLVVVLIAMPFGMGSGRRNAFVGVASSIFIGLLYIGVQQASFALGVASGGAGGVSLPPVVAAWLPNVLFGVTGVVLAMRVR